MTPFLWMGFNCLKATTTSRRQFTFYHSVPRNSWYSFYRPREDKKAQSTLEPPSGFEHKTPGLGIQCLNHYTIAPLLQTPGIQFIGTEWMDEWSSHLISFTFEKNICPLILN